MKIGYVVATPDVTTPLMPAVRGAFSENLAFLKDLGFDGVELAVRDAAAFDGDALRRTLEESGLEVSLVGTAPVSYQDGIELCHPDEATRARALERLFGHVDFAGAIGCPVNIGRFRGSLLEGEGRAASEAWMRDALRAGADRAAARGIRMLFEPHHRFNTNFVRSTREGLAFLEEMSHEAMGLLIDSFHMNVEDASFAGAIREAGEKIEYFHVADNMRTYPGSGHIPFDEIIAALREVGYAGYLSAQLAQKPDFRTAATRTMEYLRARL